MKSAIVIIPTIGSETLRQTLGSLAQQTYPDLTALIVVDGQEYWAKTNEILADHHSSLKRQVVYLTENVGKNGFYGQRVYAAFSHLVNKDILFFLDSDNWFEPTHIELMIRALESTGAQWVYSLRNIYSLEGEYLFRDDCESLGRWKAYTDTHLVDTNCYGIPREIAIKIASFWHSGWGEDRVIFNILNQHFPNYICTGKYTVNYRLGGNEGSVTKEFFEVGNAIMTQQFPDHFPWEQ